MRIPPPVDDVAVDHVDAETAAGEERCYAVRASIAAREEDQYALRAARRCSAACRGVELGGDAAHRGRVAGDAETGERKVVPVVVVVVPMPVDEGFGARLLGVAGGRGGA